MRIFPGRSAGSAGSALSDSVMVKLTSAAQEARDRPDDLLSSLVAIFLKR